MRQSTQETIRARVGELLAAQQDVTQGQFGAAIGRTGSWVSAFLAGTRHANDVRLVVKIARYFGVSVGYLLNETDRARGAVASTLLAVVEQLAPADQDVVLKLALSLRARGGGTNGAGSGDADDAPVAGGLRAPSGAPRSRPGKAR